MAKRYDLIVIGSGPAGEKGAAQAAYFGKSVALIEQAEVLGGAAANTGTLPSKTLRESALHLTGFRHRDLTGLDIQINHQVGAQKFLRRAVLVTQSERKRIARNLERHDIALLHGKACLVAPDTVEIHQLNGKTTRISGEVILIATGSSPYHPDYLAFEDSRVFDSDTILQIEHLPEQLVIVGGGVIGSEYACMFAALEIEVMLIEGRSRLLGFMDHEISDILAQSMRELGVELILEDAIERVDAGARLKIHLASGRTLESDAILAATGRSSNSAGLGLEEVGIETGRRGAIVVDENYRTSLPKVYATGDVIGFPALASTSMEQARVAMVHAFDLEYKTALAHILPFGVYTIPECSMAGETEESLQESGIDYVAGVARFGENARGQIIGDTSGFLKLLFDAGDMKLLGVHVIGEQASELVHVGLTALLLEATADLFIQTCYNYPTLSEVYKYATYDALDALAHHSP